MNCDNCNYNMCEDCPVWHKEEDPEDEETEN